MTDADRCVTLGCDNPAAWEVAVYDGKRDEPIWAAYCGECAETVDPDAAETRPLGTVLRFRVEVFKHRQGWEAKVYDHADHGPDLFYAGVTAGSLDQVLDQASHYVLMASPSPLDEVRS